MTDYLEPGAVLVAKDLKGNVGQFREPLVVDIPV